jgi:hypothetical protein
MTNPAVASVTIDKTGGTKTSSSVTLYLVASNEGGSAIGGYTGIKVDPSTTESDITWEVSLNNSDWAGYVEPSDMDCESADDITTVYARIVANNAVDTGLSTGNYEAEFEITATENPPAA